MLAALAVLSTAAWMAAAAEPVVLRGHLSDIFMAAFTPDGGRVVTASADETARLWDASNGLELRRFEGHTGPVSCLSVSGDGRTLVTGAQDNSVRVWSLPLSGPRFSTAAHASSASGLAVLPDGRTAVTIGEGKGLKIWSLDVVSSVPAGGPLPPASVVERLGHEQQIVTLAASGDGSMFATADTSGRIVIWSPLLDEPLGSLGLHLGGITGLAFHPDRQRLFSVGQDGTLRIWALPPQSHRASDPRTAALDLQHVPNQQRLVVLHADSLRIIDSQSLAGVKDVPLVNTSATAVALSADGGTAAIATEQGDVRLHRLSDAADQGRLAGHTGSVHDVAFLPDGKSLLTAGADGSVRRWMMPTAATALAGHTAVVNDVVSAPGGEWFVSAAEDKTVRMWNAAGQMVRTIGTHAAAVHSLAISTDAKAIATGDVAGTIAVWSAADGAAQGGVVGHRGGINALAFDRTTEAIWSAGSDGLVKCWRLPFVPLVALTGHTQPIRAVAAAADGRVAVTGGQDQSVRLWDGTTGQGLRSCAGQPAGPIAAVAATSDGSLVAAVTDTGGLRVWKSADGSAVFERMISGGAVFDVAFLSTTHVATIGQDNMLRIWDLAAPADAAAAAEAAAADADTRFLASNPAGTVLVASGGGKRLAVYRVAGGRLDDVGPVMIPVGSSRVTDIAFAADASLVVASCEDGRVTVWDTGHLAADATPRQAVMHPVAVRGVAVDAVTGRLVVAAEDGVTTYDIATANQAERLLPAVGQTAVVAIAGGRFLTGGQDGTGRIWTPSLERIMPTRDAATDAVRGIAVLSGDAGIVALGSGSAGLRRWKPDGSDLPALWPECTPTGLVVTSDGGSLAVVDAAGMLHTMRVGDGGMAESFEVGKGVRALGFTADASQVVLADSDSRLQAYAIDDGRLVESITLASPATRLAVTGADGRGWVTFAAEPQGSLVRRNWLATWRSGDTVAHAVAVDPAGTRHFAGFASGDVWQIATATGAIERTFTAGDSSVYDLAFEPTSGALAAATDRGLRIWSSAEEKVLVDAVVETPVHRVSFGAAAGKRIVTADEAGLVQVWDAVTGAPLEAAALHGEGPVAARFAADGQTLLSCGQDGRLAVWRSGAIASYRAAAVPLRAVVAGSGNQVLLADDEGTVRLVDLASGGIVRTICEGLQPPLTVAMRPDQQRLAVGASDGGVRIINPADGATLQVLDAETAVTSLAWRADGQRLAVGTRSSGDSPARIVGFGAPLAATPSPGKELERHDVATPSADVVQVAYDRDGRDVWSVQADGLLARWSLASPAALLKLDHGGPVLAAVISRDGQVIVSGSADNSVRIWDAVTGQQRAQMAGHTAAVHALAFNPDESLVVSAAADRTLRLWDVGGGRQLKQVATTEETVYAVAIHPSGQTVAAGGADRSVHLVNLLSGAVERSLAGHTDYVHGVSFNPAGTTLLSYGYAGELKIWGLAVGTPVLDVRVGRIGNSAAFDPKGERIVVANGDRTASIMEVPAGAR